MDATCVFSQHFFALFVRVATFTLALSLLPTRILPRIVAVALAVSMLFFFGIGKAVETCDLLSIQRLLQSQLAPTLSSIVFEISVGVVMAVFIGVVGYGANLAGLWISEMIDFRVCGLEDDDDFWGTKIFSAGRGLLSAFLLFFVTTTFVESSSGLSALFSFMAESILFVSPAIELDALMSSSYIVKNVIVAAASGASYLGLTIIIPLLIIALIVDLSFFLANRYFRSLARTSALVSVRMPIVLLLFSLTLYWQADKLVDTFEKSVSADAVQSWLTQLTRMKEP